MARAKAVTAAIVVLLPLLAVHATAEELPADSGASAAGEPADVLRSGGDLLAQVDVQVASVSPFAGGLALPVKLGTAGARLRGEVATAVSGVIDLGLLGDLGLLAISNSPTLRRFGIDTSSVPRYAPMPRPATADSRSEDHVDRRVAIDAVALGPLTAGGGHETAYAPEAGPARARTELGDVTIDLGPAAIVGAGGVAEGEATPAGIRARVAFGELRFESAGAALAVLRGVEWVLEQDLGGERSVGFNVGSGEFAGMSVPLRSPDQLGALLGPLNSALAPSGVSLTLPAATESGIGPLRIMLKDSELAFRYVNPLYSQALAGAVNAAEDALVGAVPEAGLGVTVANVLLAAATGRGGMAIDLGGIGGGIGTTPVQEFHYQAGGQEPPAAAPPALTGPRVGPADRPAAPAQTAQLSAPPAPPEPAGGRVGSPANRTSRRGPEERVPGLLVLVGGLAALGLFAAADRRRIEDWLGGVR